MGFSALLVPFVVVYLPIYYELKEYEIESSEFHVLMRSNDIARKESLDTVGNEQHV